MQRGREFWKPETYPSAGFVQHVLMVVGIAALTYLVWQVRTAFLLAFAAVIVAILPLAAAEPIRRRTSLSHKWSLAAAAVAIFAAIAIVFLLMGASSSPRLRISSAGCRWLRKTSSSSSGSLSRPADNRPRRKGGRAGRRRVSSPCREISWPDLRPGRHARRQYRSVDAPAFPGNPAAGILITPVVERRMVSIPPALLLFAVLALGLLFGPLGLVIAAPLAVVIFVAVKQLYVRETLGEPTPVPGEQ